MSKESLPDQRTIDEYHAYVQSEIRSDLNSIALGPGRLPARIAVGLTITGVISFLIGVMVVGLRMRHVYLWDWDDQFVGPFFFILFLFCCGGAAHMCIVATRRSNRFRRELYFHPLGDYGIAAVHKDDLMHQHEMKHDLKSGTNPHKVVKPSSEAYSAMKFKNGHHNEGYAKGPGDRDRDRRRPDDRDRDRRRPDDRDRDRRRPPEGGRRPPDDRERRRPPEGRYGPPEGRKGPPPSGEYRRGPPTDDRRRDDRPRGPDDRRRGPDDRPRGPDDRPRGPDDRPRGPDDRPRGPDDRPRGPDDRPRGPDDRPRGPDDRPRGPPRFADDEKRRSPTDERRPRFNERAVDDGMSSVKLEDNKESESEL